MDKIRRKKGKISTEGCLNNTSGIITAPLKSQAILFFLMVTLLSVLFRFNWLGFFPADGVFGTVSSTFELPLVLPLLVVDQAVCKHVFC